MTDVLTQYYADNPWIGITTNTHDTYVPALLDTYRTNSIYRQFVDYLIDLGAAKTKKMVFTEMYDVEPVTDAITLRTLWLASAYLDSRSLSIDLEYHAGKLAVHKYDVLVNQWQASGGDLMGVCRGQLGLMITEHLDVLARNAFLGWPYANYVGTASDFGSVQAADKFDDPEDAEKIWIHMEEREVPMAQGIEGTAHPDGTLLCITTPRVISDMRRAAGTLWRAVGTYNPSMLVRGEEGMLNSVRFVKTNRNVLWNCGAVEAQTYLSAAAAKGEGAAATVDSVYTPGQPANTRYVTVDSAAGFAVNDRVTIGAKRTSAYGVTNGADPKDGYFCTRRIVAIDGSHLAFDKPLLKDFSTDLGSGKYGWVTKGRHVHMSVFLGGPRSIVCGVGQPPSVYTPAPIDDTMSMYRFTWDGLLKYQCFRPEVAEVLYSAGSTD